jgi:hypothetical protein
MMGSFERFCEKSSALRMQVEDDLDRAPVPSATCRDVQVLPRGALLFTASLI